MDDIFKALNDPTRRHIMDLLREQDGQTVSDLTERLDMTRFGVMKHLKILEEASLVVPRRSGRFKHHYLNAASLQEVIDRWIEPLLAKPLSRKVLNLKTQLEGDDTMSTPDFVMETLIQTTPEKLWAALTQPDLIEKYEIMAAKPDRVLDGPGHYEFLMPDGHIMLGHEVTEYSPYSRLAMSFEPHWDGQDMPASSIAKEIDPRGPSVKFRVLHFGIPEGQEGVRDGWVRTVSTLKTLLETGKPLEVDPL